MREDVLSWPHPDLVREWHPANPLFKPPHGLELAHSNWLFREAWEKNYFRHYKEEVASWHERPLVVESDVYGYDWVNYEHPYFGERYCRNVTDRNSMIGKAWENKAIIFHPFLEGFCTFTQNVSEFYWLGMDRAGYIWSWQEKI